MKIEVIEGYERLASTLVIALDQAQKGKGLRHAESKPFEEQDIVQESISIGLAYTAGQARKKIKEAVVYHLGNFDPHAAIHELAGAIVSCAALIIAIEESYLKQPLEKESQEIISGTLHTSTEV